VLQFVAAVLQCVAVFGKRQHISIRDQHICKRDPPKNAQRDPQINAKRDLKRFEKGSRLHTCKKDNMCAKEVNIYVQKSPTYVKKRPT